MAIIKAVNSKASIARGINYIIQEEKTEEKLISGINCNPETAIDEMKATKEINSKATGRQYYHFIQSFNPMDRVNPQKAHQMGLKWLERVDKFKGYEIVIATHKDKEHIHNHFIINSVSFETGMKLHTNKKEYQKMKDISNEISRENGLTVPTKTQEQGKITSFNQGKYQAMKRHAEGNYKSYVLETAIAVSKVKNIAISKDDFIERIDEEGYRTNWKDTSKHITFINKDTGKRVRLSNLEKTFNDKSFKKGELISELERNSKERGRERGTYKVIERDQGIKSADEKLHCSTNGQKYDKLSNELERNTSNREHEQKVTGRNDLDITKAREYIRKTTRENAGDINKVFEPDARARTEEQRKAREVEQRNHEQHTERNRPSKSRNWEHER